MYYNEIERYNVQRIIVTYVPYQLTLKTAKNHFLFIKIEFI